MNENLYNPEYIEAFLENRLSPAETAQFKQALAKDPLLKNEVELQQDIAEAIKNHRKAEIKARLDQIEVGTTSSYTGVKIAASLLLTGLLSWGIYSAFNTSGTTVSIVDHAQKMEQTKPSEKSEIAGNNASNTTDFDKSEAPAQTISPNTAAAEAPNNNSQLAPKPGKPKNAPQVTSAGHSETPSVLEFENDLLVTDQNTQLPEDKIAQVTETKSGIDVTVDKNSDKKFHYKYNENKLFLYGNFDAKTYEILELNTYKEKQLYLFYDNSYYLLNSNQLNPIPLKKITDKKRIGELDKVNKQ